MTDQIQSVWLTGELIGPDGMNPDFDVGFSWDITTGVASDFSVPCAPFGFDGVQSESVTVSGNNLLVSGACGNNLLWRGEVAMDTYSPTHFWVGEVIASDPPVTTVPEPGVAALCALAAGIMALWRHRESQRCSTHS